jgi:hypothetical protein
MCGCDSVESRRLCAYWPAPMTPAGRIALTVILTIIGLALVSIVWGWAYS